MKNKQNSRRLTGKLLYLMLLTLLLVSFLAVGTTTVFAQTLPTPPTQPATGPGGSNYPYAEVKTSTYGSGEAQYWIFEPASPTPTSAPIIVFNHGYLGIDPSSYTGWINHLVRQGNIVIYPAYQQLLTPLTEVSENAISAVKNAIATLKTGDHVLPDPDKFAIIGHSLGGVITVNMASQAGSNGLPVPKAIMLVEASDGSNIVETNLVTADFTNLPVNLLLIAISAADDSVAGSEFSQRAIQESAKVPAVNKNLIILHSDNHGSPELVADHLAPLSPEHIAGTLENTIMDLIDAKIDALDYYGFWKLFDGLYQAAFGINPENRKFALGNTPEQRYMGLWSDGVPVKELEVITDSNAGNTITPTPTVENPPSGKIELPEIKIPDKETIQKIIEDILQFDLNKVTDEFNGIISQFAPGLDPFRY
jgi:hypothetical protein